MKLPALVAYPPGICLCGCGVKLPADLTYFATNACIGRWEQVYGHPEGAHRFPNMETTP